MSEKKNSLPLSFVLLSCAIAGIKRVNFSKDVEDIKYVINFDYPNCSEDYVHRIGRTGRRDNKGVAYTFFTDEDEKQAYDLVKVLQQAKQDVHPQLLAMANRMSAKNSRQWGGWTKRKNGDFNDNRDFGNKRFKKF